MKRAIVFQIAAILFLMSCNESSNEAQTSKDSVNIDNIDAMQSKTGSVDDIVTGYLAVKNALADDNSKAAASAANEVILSVDKFNVSGLDTAQKKVYNDVIDDVQEHARHIADKSSDIEHQREHFDLLSGDLIDLVKATGSSKTLYRDFCPMYNDKRGASWLSEQKEIRNPYYGKEMLTCGEVKEEIKPKQ